MSSQFWTKADAERLSKLVRSGKYTRHQIAEMMGRTRNSITGKIVRDGIGGPNEYLRHDENSASHKKLSGNMSSSWDVRVFEPWSVYRAHRVAERSKMKEMQDA